MKNFYDIYEEIIVPLQPPIFKSKSTDIPTVDDYKKYTDLDYLRLTWGLVKTKLTALATGILAFILFLNYIFNK